MKPLCFVLMPFGKKPHASGMLIDFDAVYSELIRPAIEAADLEPIRADEEVAGGIIHKPMFERLILCEYAVADLTTANANVFYEWAFGTPSARQAQSSSLRPGVDNFRSTSLHFGVCSNKLTPDGKPADP